MGDFECSKIRPVFCVNEMLCSAKVQFAGVKTGEAKDKRQQSPYLKIGRNSPIKKQNDRC